MTIHSAGTAASAATRADHGDQELRLARTHRAGHDSNTGGREPSNKAVNDRSIHEQDEGTRADQGNEDKPCVGHFGRRSRLGSIKFAWSISLAQALRCKAARQPSTEVSRANWHVDDRLESTGRGHHRCAGRSAGAGPGREGGALSVDPLWPHFRIQRSPIPVRSGAGIGLRQVLRSVTWRGSFRRLSGSAS